MSRWLKPVAIGLVVAGILAIALGGTAFAASAGSSDTAGGYSYGECSDGAGPGLDNHWGGSAVCNGNSYGESSDGAGPGLNNQWGKDAQ
jgi:hypothetical protein